MPGEQQHSAMEIIKMFFLTQKSVRLEELIKLLRKEQKKVEDKKRALTEDETKQKELTQGPEEMVK